jgi:hypothetical protein
MSSGSETWMSVMRCRDLGLGEECAATLAGAVAACQRRSIGRIAAEPIDFMARNVYSVPMYHDNVTRFRPAAHGFAALAMVWVRG